METIERLIETALSAQASAAEEAVTRLVAIGMPAVPAVIEALRTSADGLTWNLSKMLLRLRDPERIPVLVGLLHETKADVVHTAFRALKLSGDRRALAPLQDYLLDSTNWEVRRALAAEALGELGSLQTMDPLLRAAQDVLNEPDVAPIVEGRPLSEETYVDEDLLLLFLAIAVALAKLGNHDMAPVVTTLIRYRADDVYSQDQIIRERAAKALHYTVSPGVFAVLKEALRDDFDEVRLNAVDALFYLGLKAALSTLIGCMRDENPTISDRALIRLGDLTGERFGGDVREADAWWEKQQDAYETGICYRLGAPLFLPNVMAFLAHPHLREQVINEVQIITGERFGYNPYVPLEDQVELLPRAQAWWAENSGRFEAGCLYKYGYKQDLAGIDALE